LPEGVRAVGPVVAQGVALAAVRVVVRVVVQAVVLAVVPVAALRRPRWPTPGPIRWSCRR